jgi:hypothetical protein
VNETAQIRTMFERLKMRWAEARADVVSEQVNDALQRIERMHFGDEGLVARSFESVLSELEDQFGPVQPWPSEQKKQVAREILESSQQAFRTQGNGVFAETARVTCSTSTSPFAPLMVMTTRGAQRSRRKAI